MLRKFWAIKNFTDGSQRLCLLRDMGALEGHATFPFPRCIRQGSVPLARCGNVDLWNVDPEGKRTNGAPH